MGAPSTFQRKARYRAGGRRRRETRNAIAPATTTTTTAAPISTGLPTRSDPSALAITGALAVIAGLVETPGLAGAAALAPKAGLGTVVGDDDVDDAPGLTVGVVVVNRKLPWTGCPSSETTRQFTVYRPGGLPAVTGCRSSLATITGRPLATLPSDPSTTTAVPSRCAGSAK